jgi:inner membrane protein involved in colicin E2 resistance
VFALFSFSLGALADHIGVVPALIVAVLLSLVPLGMYWHVLRPRVAAHTQ